MAEKAPVAESLSTNKTTKLQSLAEGVDKELTCAICLSRIMTPKVLPCLHSYCKGCLETMAEKAHDKRITCPQCKEEHEVPAKGVEGFKTYFTINNLLELLHIHEVADSEASNNSSKGGLILCESGLDENQAVARCLTCSEYLCESCLSIHKKLKFSKGHDVATLEEIKQLDKKAGARSLRRKQTCEEHEGEILKLFCKTCKQVICRDCALVKHRDHDFVFVRDLRPKVQEDLEQLLKNIQGKQVEFESHTSYVDGLRTLSKSALDKCTKEVQETYQSLIAQLENQRAALIGKLHSIHESETSKIDAEAERLSLARKHFSDSVGFTRQLLDKGDDVEVMLMSVQTKKTLEVLGKMTWDKETLKPTLLRMKFDPKVKNMSSFGTVVHTLLHSDITVKGLPPAQVNHEVNKKLDFKVQLAASITEMGYNAASLSVKIACMNKEIPVNVKSSGVNCWTVTCTPRKEGLHTVTIKTGGISETVNFQVFLPPTTPTKSKSISTLISVTEHHKQYNIQVKPTRVQDVVTGTPLMPLGKCGLCNECEQYESEEPNKYTNCGYCGCGVRAHTGAEKVLLT